MLWGIAPVASRFLTARLSLAALAKQAAAPFSAQRRTAAGPQGKAVPQPRRRWTHEAKGGVLARKRWPRPQTNWCSNRQEQCHDERR